MAELPERNESLWRLTISPVIWSVHFLVSYVTVAVWCAKVAGRYGLLSDARVLVAVYTVIALAGIAVTGWDAYRRHRIGGTTVPHDFDTAEDRHRFLGFASLLLSLLSGVATIYVALAAVFIQTCH